MICISTGLVPGVGLAIQGRALPGIDVLLMKLNCLNNMEDEIARNSLNESPEGALDRISQLHVSRAWTAYKLDRIGHIPAG